MKNTNWFKWSERKKIDKKISQRFTLIFSRKNALCGYSLEFRALLLLPDSGAQ